MRRRRNGSGWERRRNVQATDNGSVGKTTRAWSAAGADGRRSLEVARSYGNVRGRREPRQAESDVLAVPLRVVRLALVEAQWTLRVNSGFRVEHRAKASPVGWLRLRRWLPS